MTCPRGTTQMGIRKEGFSFVASVITRKERRHIGKGLRAARITGERPKKKFLRWNSE